MTETTSFPTRRRVGTLGVKGIVLCALDIGTGKLFNKWFTFGRLKELGLMNVPIAELVVPVETVTIGGAR